MLIQRRIVLKIGIYKLKSAPSLTCIASILIIVFLFSGLSSTVMAKDSVDLIIRTNDPGSEAPAQPYVDLYAQKTEVNVGEEIILYLTAINPVTSPGTLVIQLTLRVPSGWSITSSGFGTGSGGVRTNSYEIQQGANQRSINISIIANQGFEGNLEANIDYYYIGDEANTFSDQVTIPVKATMPETAIASAKPVESNDSPIQGGISGGIIAAIISITMAIVGGVLTRFIWKRMNTPATVPAPVSATGPDSSPVPVHIPENPVVDIPEAIPPPTTIPEPMPQDPSDPLDINRKPVETVLDITEGQVGVSYQKLFAPYVKDAQSITIFDPYVQRPSQIYNLLNFFEILNARKTNRVMLITNKDKNPESQQEIKLNELKKGLAKDNIIFEYEFDDKQHDRWIETNTGWRIIMGRGLDIFQSREDYYSRGFSDQTKRKCRATTITYTRK